MSQGIITYSQRMTADNSILLREMSELDIPPVLDMINAEGWNYDTIDIVRILKVSPHDSIVACSGMDVVGALTATHHSRRAVLGHVVVRTDSRRKNIGKMMMKKALQNLDQKGMEIVELYSLPEVRQFYSDIGFRKIGDLTIYEGTPGKGFASKPSGSELRNLKEEDFEEVVRLDARVLGWNRKEIIRVLMLPYLANSFGLFREGRLIGFALGRSADNAAEVGPWLIEQPDYDNARALLEATMLSVGRSPFYVEINNDNLLASKIALDLGFEPKHPVERMVRSMLEVGNFNMGVLSYAALEFG